jgi:hypothetical protein
MFCNTVVLILSTDESKVYRIVLAAATRRWNDSQEFNLYFVETYQDEDFGDKATTLILKGSSEKIVGGFGLGEFAK